MSRSLKDAEVIEELDFVVPCAARVHYFNTKKEPDPPCKRPATQYVTWHASGSKRCQPASITLCDAHLADLKTWPPCAYCGAPRLIGAQPL